MYEYNTRGKPHRWLRVQAAVNALAGFIVYLHVLSGTRLGS